MYHGFKKNANYFEGWYYKLVDKDKQNVYALIPGIFKSKDQKESHCFIMIMNGIDNKSYYFKYPVSDFKSDKEDFNILIKENFFSLHKVSININKKNCMFMGELEFSGFKPWPVTLMSPGVMGWYAYMPFLECYHGVLSFDHHVAGKLHNNEKEIDFSGGRGYIEKDWGKSFPSSWFWLQSNHFKEKGNSLFISVALIPWIGNEFRGFIAGLWYNGSLLKFTTYNKSSINNFEVVDDKINLELENKKFRFNIQTDKSDGCLLYGPSRNKMVQNVKESILAKVAVNLFDKKTGNLIYSDIGDFTGMELNGEFKKLLIKNDK